MKSENSLHSSLPLSVIGSISDLAAKDAVTKINMENAVNPSEPAKQNGLVESEIPPPSNLCFMYRLNRLIRRSFTRSWSRIRQVLFVSLFLGYIAYCSYCMYVRFGDEPSGRLLVGTILGCLILLRRFIKCRCSMSLGKFTNISSNHQDRLKKIVRCSIGKQCATPCHKTLDPLTCLLAVIIAVWEFQKTAMHGRALYVLAAGGAVVVVVMEVALKQPENLVSLLGLILLILLSFFLSRQPEKINWHAVFWGMGLQFWFAVFIKKTHFGSAVFEWLSQRFEEFFKYADKGSQSVFGAKYLDHPFVFQLMPMVIFFNAVINALYYLGVMQVFIASFGKFLSFCLHTSPLESVSTAASLILSQLETIVLIKPFIQGLTLSEMFAVLTANFSSITGSLLSVFAGFGVPVFHVLTASVMSAPAALAFAKLLYPEEYKPKLKAKDVYKMDIGQGGTLLGAISEGAKQGLKLVAIVVINQMVFVAVLEFLDQTFLWFTDRSGLENFTFRKLLAYIFYPLTYLMGFEARDCFQAAGLLGIKLSSTTILSFADLGTIIINSKKLQNYTAVYNDSWTYDGDDIVLLATNTTLVGGVMTERSGVVATYMLCGLSHLGALGVAMGIYPPHCPNHSESIMRIIPLALLAGNMASFSTACVAGWKLRYVPVLMSSFVV